VNFTTALAVGLLAVTLHAHAPMQAEAKVEKVVDQPAPGPHGTRLAGNATWYAYKVGGAAAGPRLRKWLGKGWRGTKVTVCHGAGNCVRVTLSDWCLCSHGNRVIDLDVRAFASLVPTSRGVTSVTVTR